MIFVPVSVEQYVEWVINSLSTSSLRRLFSLQVRIPSDAVGKERRRNIESYTSIFLKFYYIKIYFLKIYFLKISDIRTHLLLKHL